LPTAFAAYGQTGAGAMIVTNDPLFQGWRGQIAALATRHAVPTMLPDREFVAAGCLISYGASLSDSFRQVGVYVGRILKGAKPDDLPVQHGQIRDGDQSQDRQGARPGNPAEAAVHRRRGDRITRRPIDSAPFSSEASATQSFREDSRDRRTLRFSVRQRQSQTRAGVE
jgi:ABC transporter substrate binding protein